MARTARPPARTGTSRSCQSSSLSSAICGLLSRLSLERRALVHAVGLFQRLFVVEVGNELLVLPVVPVVAALDPVVFDDRHDAAALLAGVGGVRVDMIVDHPAAGIVRGQDQIVAFTRPGNTRSGL